MKPQSIPAAMMGYSPTHKGYLLVNSIRVLYLLAEMWYSMKMSFPFLCWKINHYIYSLHLEITLVMTFLYIKRETMSFLLNFQLIKKIMPKLPIPYLRVLRFVVHYLMNYRHLQDIQPETYIPSQWDKDYILSYIYVDYGNIAHS